jgi:kynurenine formamidase
MKTGVPIVRVGALSAALGALAILVPSHLGNVAAQDSTSHLLITQEQYKKWQTGLSNWGRWGPKDGLGTLNLVTPAKRKQAAALVKEGFTVSLARTASTIKDDANPCPIEWAMATLSENGATDKVAYRCIHGPGTTHLDSFAHVFFDGKMYNGYPWTTISKKTGPSIDSINVMKNGIVTRAVFYDIPKLKGVPYLEPGTRIYPEDLEAWEKKTGVKVGPGDAIVMRWGKFAWLSKVGPQPGDPAAGFDNSVIPWLKQRDVALLVWETPGYSPQPLGDLGRTALHNMVLTILGIHILDRADLEALSEAAAARNRYEFMLIVAPLPIPNGTGSPVNPVAIF